jgi:hypothetical protein
MDSANVLGIGLKHGPMDYHSSDSRYCFAPSVCPRNRNSKLHTHPKRDPLLGFQVFIRKITRHLLVIRRSPQIVHEVDQFLRHAFMKHGQKMLSASDCLELE